MNWYRGRWLLNISLELVYTLERICFKFKKSNYFLQILNLQLRVTYLLYWGQFVGELLQLGSLLLLLGDHVLLGQSDGPLHVLGVADQLGWEGRVEYHCDTNTHLERSCSPCWSPLSSWSSPQGRGVYSRLLAMVKSHRYIRGVMSLLTYVFMILLRAEMSFMLFELKLNLSFTIYSRLQPESLIPLLGNALFVFFHLHL